MAKEAMKAMKPLQCGAFCPEFDMTGPYDGKCERDRGHRGGHRCGECGYAEGGGTDSDKGPAAVQEEQGDCEGQRHEGYDSLQQQQYYCIMM